jgi:hydroxymethylpyrimidine/phosphomethylpyrimidine kinase
MKSVLTIAGSDPSGGAGIQADLAAFAYAGVHGCTVVTCVTAQNLKEVAKIHAVPLDIIESQLDSVLGEKNISACKTGMLYSPDIVRLIADKSTMWDFPLIVDPVMKASAGQNLSTEGFSDAVIEHLISRATLFTPNVPEACAITGMNITNLEEMEGACKTIHGKGCDYVLIKGGHLDEHHGTDILFDGKDFRVFLSKSHPGEVRGSGCTFSALICAFIARGMDVADAVEEAKLHMGIYFERGGVFSESFTQPQEMPDPFMTAEEQQVYGLLSKAASELPGILPVSFVPEVGVNIGFALPNATEKREVCALEGRFVRTGDTIMQAGGIAYGGSTHVARIILTAMKYERLQRSAMNVRYTPAIIKACRSAGLSISAFDRKFEPKGASTMEWGVKAAIKKTGGVPDIIYDKGGMGKEPMIRILGRDPLDVLNKLILITENNPV